LSQNCKKINFYFRFNYKVKFSKYIFENNYKYEYYLLSDKNNKKNKTMSQISRSYITFIILFIYFLLSKFS